MTIDDFINMIGRAETAGAANEHDRLWAIGDGGLAGGFYQMHWAWRRDYWEEVDWLLLEVMDRYALRRFIARHPDMTARQLAATYNLGHSAVDPAYSVRCLRALAALSIPVNEFDGPVKD